MLSLTRKSGEAIRVAIDGRVFTVKVSNIRGGKVCLGIDAPQEFRIARDELPPMRQHPAA
jgi:carbon storage regulator CsrA